MRLIDADALEKAIYKWMPKDTETWMDSSIPPIEDLVVSIMMTIEEQPTVNQWIPVSERLPEEGKRVLVYIDRPTNQICVSQRTDVTYWIGLGCVNVVAWMELPEEYKGERKYEQ